MPSLKDCLAAADGLHSRADAIAKSWTTKNKLRMLFESPEEALAYARRIGLKTNDQSVTYSSSEHGYVLWNEAGTKAVSARTWKADAARG